jgi:hypothetical protein
LLSGSNGVSGAFVGFSIGSPKLPAELWPVAQKLLSQNVGAAVSTEPLVQFDADKAFAFSSVHAGAQPYVAGWGSISDDSKGAPYGGLMVGT